MHRPAHAGDVRKEHGDRQTFVNGARPETRPPKPRVKSGVRSSMINAVAVHQAEDMTGNGRRLATRSLTVIHFVSVPGAGPWEE